MSRDRWDAFDLYTSDLFIPHDPVLEKALAASTRAGLPPYQVSPSQGKLLYLLARMHNARRILELGTLGGYSTIWLARALKEGGRLVTLELKPEHARVASGNIDRAGLSEIVEIRTGPALETLRQLEAERCEPFDFFFIDADKKTYPEYLSWSLKLSRNGSIIVVDNVVRGGAVLEQDSSDPSVLGVRRMNEMIAAEPRLTATTIQTVGSRGYDGFALILVDDPAEA